VVHGSLQPKHAAVGPDGHCQLLDWTRAMAGPAGLSLQGLVGSCLPPRVLLPVAAAPTAEATDDEPLLAHYRQALVQRGYADEATLRQGLPAAIAAGLIGEVLYLARNPVWEPDDRRIVADRLGAKLELLAGLCMRLA
jgi:hypothetical protein